MQPVGAELVVNGSSVPIAATHRITEPRLIVSVMSDGGSASRLALTTRTPSTTPIAIAADDHRPRDVRASHDSLVSYFMKRPLHGTRVAAV